MDFEGKVRPGHVIIHWNMDVAFETLPRQYDDWDVAKRDIAEWLGSGKAVSWEVTTLWKRLPALHLLLDGKVTDELLVEYPLITAGPDGTVIDPMLPDAASASEPAPPPEGCEI